MEAASTFLYKADQTQLAFLQISSSRARQNLTYECKNSIGFYDAVAGSHSKAVRLMSWNDKQLRHDGNHMFTYRVLLDECQHKTNEWQRSVFEYSTDVPNRLPLRDIAPYDVGDDGQEFGLQIGPACFF